MKINNKLRGMHNTNSDIKFKVSIIRSNLCGYSDAYINVKGITRDPDTSVPAEPVNYTNKKVT